MSDASVLISKPLGEVANTFAGGTPSRSISDYFVGEIPWVKSTEVNQTYIEQTEEYISDRAVIASSAKWVNKDSVLVAMYGATAGQISELRINATTNQAVLAIDGYGEVTNRYLYYYLINAKEKLLYLAQGSGQPNLSKALVDRLVIKYPPKKEQQKIAEILTTIDNLIEKTEALIKKYQAIKQGMMHDLFTRGIHTNGQLRPSQKDAPHLYKQSELGWIPKDWCITALGLLGRFKNGLNKPKDCFGYGTLFINILDVYPEELDIKLLGRMYATVKEISDNKAEGGDIFIDRSSVTLEGVGYPTIFLDSSEDVIFCGFIIRYRLENDDLNPWYLCAQMRNKSFRQRIFQIATRSANINVNQEQLSKLKIIIPSPSEQKAIEKKLKTIQSRIDSEVAYMKKYQETKKGLMQDLLTGRVRTDFLSIENGGSV